MINVGKFRLVAIAALAAVLAGCQGMGPPPSGVPMAAAPAPTSGFDGEWLSMDGVARSRFNAGIFETLASDTGNKLAEGTYTQTGPNTVTISVTSLIRQTTTQVNCAMVSQTQLNCTSSTAQQFSLVRRSIS